MKLNPELRKRLTSQLILRANELYHDFENAHYDERQQGWFATEEALWRRLANQHLLGIRPLRVLDFGCGTGLVSRTIGPLLRAGDELTCCDISRGILEVCQKNLESLPIPCQTNFLHASGGRIPIADSALDAIVLNAVLHHLFDLAEFASDCARALRPGGLLIVAHEPSGDVQPNGSRWTILKHPGKLGVWLAEHSSLAERALRGITSAVSNGYRRRNRMLAEIARRLHEEGLVDRSLRGTELQEIVDVQVEAGLRRATIEFAFSGFEFVNWDTYNQDQTFGFVARRLAIN